MLAFLNVNAASKITSCLRATPFLKRTKDLRTVKNRDGTTDNSSMKGHNNKAAPAASSVPAAVPGIRRVPSSSSSLGSEREPISKTSSKQQRRGKQTKATGGTAMGSSNSNSAPSPLSVPLQNIYATPTTAHPMEVLPPDIYAMPIRKRSVSAHSAGGTERGVQGLLEDLAKMDQVRTVFDLLH